LVIFDPRGGSRANDPRHRRREGKWPVFGGYGSNDPDVARVDLGIWSIYGSRHGRHSTLLETEFAWCSHRSSLLDRSSWYQPGLLYYASMVVGVAVHQSDWREGVMSLLPLGITSVIASNRLDIWWMLLGGVHCVFGVGMYLYARSRPVDEPV
jgi:hypothetical protein